MRTLKTCVLKKTTHLIVGTSLQESGAGKLFGATGNHRQVDGPAKHRDVFGGVKGLNYLATPILQQQGNKGYCTGL